MKAEKTQDSFSEYAKTVKVIPDFSSDVTVSPFLFGNNLEHTRSCVSGGISAQLLRNRKFAGKPGCCDGCPAEWYPVGEQTYLIFNEKEDGNVSGVCEGYTRHGDGYHMKRRHECNTVTAVNYSAGVCGIGQKGIPLKKGVTYVCRLAAKVWQRTEIEIVLADRDGKVYCQRELVYDGDKFENKSVVLRTPVEDREARLEIRFYTPGTVAFGAVSLLPENNFHGMRPDVISLLHQMGVKLLRWPGGNFAGEYNWKDGLLPVDERAPLESFMGLETQPHSMGYDFSEINTDDFVALCREIGAEPFITINPTWNTPEECAQWVEYCNGDENTVYGRLRIARGFPEPYHVRFWSLGNEFGYGHMEGDNTAQGYSRRASEYGKKMLEVSSDLILCSSGPYPNPEWAEYSAGKLKEIAPLVSLHSYVAQPLFADPDNFRQEYYDCIDKVTTQCRNLVHTLRTQLKDEKQKISFDEWNVWYSWYRPPCVSDGIFTAAMLHMLMEEAGPSGIFAACHFEAVNEGAIRVQWDRAILTPGGQMFAVMKNHIGGRLCFAHQDAVATERDEILTMTLLNRSFEEKKEFVLPRYGKTVTAVLYQADRVVPYSDFEKTEVKLKETGENYTAVLPKHSVMLIQMKKEKEGMI